MISTQVESEKFFSIEVWETHIDTVVLLVWEHGEPPVRKTLYKGDKLEVTHTLKLDVTK